MSQFACPDLARSSSAAGSGLPESDRRGSGWAVVAAVLTPAILVGGWLLGDALQPAGYSPLRQTMSVLAGQQGTDSWVMTGAFGLVGFAMLATGAGLTAVRWPARLLLALAGLSSIGVAACPEPATGPTPLHLAFAVICVVATAIWPAAAAERAGQVPWVLRYQTGRCVTACFAGLSVWVLVATQSGIDLGLAERLTSAAQAIWPLVVAAGLWLAARQSADDQAAGEPVGQPAVSAPRPDH